MCLLTRVLVGLSPSAPLRLPVPELPSLAHSLYLHCPWSRAHATRIALSPRPVGASSSSLPSPPFTLVSAAPVPCVYGVLLLLPLCAAPLHCLDASILCSCLHSFKECNLQSLPASASLPLPVCLCRCLSTLIQRCPCVPSVCSVPCVRCTGAACAIASWLVAAAQSRSGCASRYAVRTSNIRS